jgi:Dyp-type peroxidase family
MDPANIQGNFLRGYTHPCCTIRFLEVTDAARAREWLRRVLPFVTSEAPWDTKPDTTLNLMFTFGGLRALDAPDAVLQAFPPEFQQGMAGRAELLDDTAENAPANWTDGLGTGRIHIAVSVYALDEAALAGRLAQLAQFAAETGGLTVVSEQVANRLVRDGPDGKKHYPEHFGYSDGLGQPAFAGLPTEPGPGGGSPEARGAWRDLALGEFLLGYENEGKEFPSSGLPEPLWRDSTYVVYRKLYQDVAGFRRYLRDEGAGYPGGPLKVAAKIVGRWPDGTPLALRPDAPDPQLAWDAGRNNDFRYADDAAGMKCPIGAHIRRANPRDALPFGASMVNSHRLIRRGIPYGPALPEGALEDDGADRGFLFIAYQTNIARQFEFVQALWMNDGNKFGLGDDRDPLVGQGAGSGKMTISGKPPYFLAPLPSFLRVRGGEYFLRPGLKGLEYLAAGSGFAAAPTGADVLPAPAPAEGFVLKLGEEAAGWLKGIGAQISHGLQAFGLQHPHLSAAQFSLLRQHRPIFVAGHLAIVTRADDVREVLNDGVRFPVAYGPVMEELAGPGTLGMGPTAEYERDTAALRAVVRAEDLPRIARVAEETVSALLAPLQVGGRLDLVRDVCNPVPIRVLADYFGTPGVTEALQLEWSHKLFEEIFGNIWDNVADITPAGRAAAAQWCAYVDGLIAQRRRAIAEGANTPDDLLDRLLRQQFGPGPSLTDERIRANLIYMTVGFIPQVSKVTILALDELLGRPAELAGAQAAARAGDLDLVAAYVWEALRFNAETPGLFRKCADDTTVARGTERETHIPGGALVLAATQSAAFDEAVVPNPDDFRTDRPWSTYLYFGSGQHSCLGEHVSRAQVPRIAMALLRLSGLRRAPGAAGKLSWDGIWPARLEVEFDTGAPR